MATVRDSLLICALGHVWTGQVRPDGEGSSALLEVVGSKRCPAPCRRKGYAVRDAEGAMGFASLNSDRLPCCQCGAASWAICREGCPARTSREHNAKNGILAEAVRREARTLAMWVNELDRCVREEKYGQADDALEHADRALARVRAVRTGLKHRSRSERCQEAADAVILLQAGITTLRGLLVSWQKLCEGHTHRAVGPCCEVCNGPCNVYTLTWKAAPSC
jgi:hypothetical protein